jgi:Bardet-Biedl syndrome 2 protein
MCYDIVKNKTLFNKEINDGVYCLASGIFSNYTFPICLVGGNCSLQGFDINGDEKFWTVTGGNTLCLSLNDVDDDSYQEVIVGTDDFAIRFYKNENNIHEINENTKIVLLQSVANSKFIYGLENGTIGLYDRGERIWKRKEKGILNTVLSIDVNNDGLEEVFCGWSTGKLQMRNLETGDVMMEIDLNREISKLLLGDLNNSGRNQIICCSSKGEIDGFIYVQEDKQLDKVQIFSTGKDTKIDKEELTKYEKFLQDKKSLMDKVEEITIQLSNKNKNNLSRDENILPQTTNVKIDLQSNNEAKCADLIIEASPSGTIIKCIVIVSEQLYKGETFIQYPQEETNKVIVQIKNEKDMNINLHIKVLVGISSFAKDYQVFEFNKIIPKYCFYILLRDDISQYKTPLKQGVILKVNERLERLLIWLEQNFNIPIKELNLFKNNEIYDIRFLSLRTDKVLQIYMQNTTIQIMTDEIELGGNVLQDLCKSFQINDIDTSISYPDIVEELGILIKRIEKLDSVRNQFNINMAEIITFIKDLFVKAEDNRLLDNMYLYF